MFQNEQPGTHPQSKEAKSGETIQENRDNQGVDKMLEQEKGKGDQVTSKNLKGKQVDEDPDSDEGKPLDI